MIDRAQLIVNRLLIEDEINDFDMISEIDNLPNKPMEYWALYVGLDYAEQKNYWFHVAFRRPTDWPEYSVGITINAHTPHAQLIIDVALSKGFNPQHVKDIRAVCKTDKLGYQLANELM